MGRSLKVRLDGEIAAAIRVEARETGKTPEEVAVEVLAAELRHLGYLVELGPVSPCAVQFA